MEPLATVTFASGIDGAIQRKMCWQGFVRAGKGITLHILNEDMDDTIKIIKSLENSDVLLDDASETVKTWNKRTGWINVRKYVNWKRSRDSRKRV